MDNQPYQAESHPVLTSKHFAGICFLTGFKNLLPSFSGVTEPKRPQRRSCEASLGACTKAVFSVKKEKLERHHSHITAIKDADKALLKAYSHIPATGV